MDLIETRWASRFLSNYAQQRYQTYPHSNGFADGGRSLVLGQMEGDHVSLWKIRLSDGEERQIARFKVDVDPTAPSLSQVWFDVAESINTLVAMAERTVWLIALDSPDGPRELYRQPDGLTLNPLPSISPDGRRVLINAKRSDGMHGGLMIDVGSGHTEFVVTHVWWANHFHFSPYDPNWIAYCHEGDTMLIPDRMWAWHAAHAPHGQPILDQHWNDLRRRLSIGHERACFHTGSLLTIAYGVSVGGPRGLYEVFFDRTRSPRLVSEGNRDWHCNVSRDGRWAVVDTTGPHDQPGKGWDEATDISDIVLVDMNTGERRAIARSHQVVHPWHPHPTFSPDGRCLVYNEGQGTRASCTGRVILLQMQS